MHIYSIAVDRPSDNTRPTTRVHEAQMDNKHEGVLDKVYLLAVGCTLDLRTEQTV